MKLLLTLLLLISINGYSQDKKEPDVKVLQHINDSLTAKLQLMLEYYELSCPIIETLELKGRAGYEFVRSKDRMKLVEAVKRYLERYLERYSRNK